MIIIDDEWCFIHIPKTSGTNLSKVFPDGRSKKYLHNEFWDGFWDGSLDPSLIPYAEIIRNVNVVKHAPLSFWKKMGIVNDHKIFTIVRNPYTRLVSWYNEVKRDGGRTDVPFKNLVLDEEYNEILEWFPYKCFSNKTNQIDYFIDLDGGIRLDKFYKMECDLEKIESDFGISNINAYKYNTASYDKKYEELYDDELIEWVQRTYSRDFEYFGYETELDSTFKCAG